jgi:hypothetical protein
MARFCGFSCLLNAPPRGFFCGVRLLRCRFFLCRDGALAPLAQCKIVLLSPADGDTDHLAGLVRDDELGFLGVALLLPAVGAPLVFCGRSIGLSAPSTTITSNGVPPACKVFFPGRWHSLLLMRRCAIRCTVRHTTDAVTPHESPRWK